VIKAGYKLLVCSNQRDFDALVEFFAALGLTPGESWSGERSSGAKMEAPRAGVEIGLGEGFPQADVVLECDSADVMYELLKRRQVPVASDIADTGWGARMFVVEMPAAAGRLAIFSYREKPAGSSGPVLDARGLRFAIVVSRFNSFITERLLAGAVDGLRRAGAGPAAIETVWVPGAFEVPGAARALARSKRFDAIVCLGCLLRGDTLHYEVIANEVARGIGQSVQETAVPHAFGVLTCDTLEQAIERVGLKAGNKGWEAAMAAVEMARVNRAAGAGGGINARRAPAARQRKRRNGGGAGAKSRRKR
jgi:6,7-dimethyl-8-ribityllumazine synthase